MNNRIFLSSPHMGGAELDYINEAFDTNWISPVGPNIAGFEKDISAYAHNISVAALTSGTAAIHLALIILGVKEGDEVICSSFTFAGSCNPIAYLKATPVFVDSEKDTWNIDPELMRDAIEDRIKKGKKPKAIVLVHLYGMPAKMDELMAVAREFEIPVVEDAAEALGSSYKGKKLGTFGDIGVYSFNGNKIITTSGGGAMVSFNQDYIEKAKFLATQARDNAPHYEHTHIGYNYRMSNISAGIGRGQMQVLDKHIEYRRQNFEFYKNLLRNDDRISFVEELNETFSNRWLTTIVIKQDNNISPRGLREFLEENNVESRPLWKPMHMQPVYDQAPYYGNGTSEYLFQHGLCLPSGSNMTDEERLRIETCLLSYL